MNYCIDCGRVTFAEVKGDGEIYFYCKTCALKNLGPEVEVYIEIEEGKRMSAVLGFCSQCGKFPKDGCYWGYMEDGIAHAFCDDNCLSQWHIDHGRESTGEIKYAEL